MMKTYLQSDFFLSDPINENNMQFAVYCKINFKIMHLIISKIGETARIHGIQFKIILN